MRDWIRVPPILNREVPPATAQRLIVDHLAAKGWEVRRHDAPGRSITIAPFCLMILSGWEGRSTFSKVALLAHELAHVHQFGKSLWTRTWRTILYMVSRKTRLAMEVEAKAHAAHARFCMSPFAYQLAKTDALYWMIETQVASLTRGGNHRTGEDRGEVEAMLISRFHDLVK